MHVITRLDAISVWSESDLIKFMHAQSGMMHLRADSFIESYRFRDPTCDVLRLSVRPALPLSTSPSSLIRYRAQ